MRGRETRCECYWVLEMVSEGEDGDDRWGFQRVWGGENLPESPRCRHNVLRMGPEHTRQVLESQSGGRGRVSCWHSVPLHPPWGWSLNGTSLTAHNSRPEKPNSSTLGHLDTQSTRQSYPPIPGRRIIRYWPAHPPFPHPIADPTP
jgi:hypothetical protein